MAIELLIFDNTMFVAAEFSLTALNRSTVEANARDGTRQDRCIRHAHHKLSFQLSGAQLVISITTLAIGYLTDPMMADLPHPALDAIGIPDRVVYWITTLLGVGDSNVGVNGFRRAGTEVYRRCASA